MLDGFQVFMKTPVHLYLEPASETTILALLLPATEAPFIYFMYATGLTTLVVFSLQL